jgi:hypothetical protein
MSEEPAVSPDRHFAATGLAEGGWKATGGTAGHLGLVLGQMPRVSEIPRLLFGSCAYASVRLPEGHVAFGANETTNSPVAKVMVVINWEIGGPLAAALAVTIGVEVQGVELSARQQVALVVAPRRVVVSVPSDHLLRPPPLIFERPYVSSSYNIMLR